MEGRAKGCPNLSNNRLEMYREYALRQSEAYEILPPFCNASREGTAANAPAEKFTVFALWPICARRTGHHAGATSYFVLHAHKAPSA